MRIKGFKYISAIIFCLVFFAQHGNAQFKEGAFTQNYNEPGDSLATSDSVDKLFSFKEFFGGLGHKNPLKIGTMKAESTVATVTPALPNSDCAKGSPMSA